MASGEVCVRGVHFSQKARATYVLVYLCLSLCTEDFLSGIEKRKDYLH